MRSREEVALVAELVEQGYNDCQIARLTGVPRIRWTSTPKQISVYRKASVGILDSFIGPKT